VGLGAVGLGDPEPRKRKRGQKEKNRDSSPAQCRPANETSEARSRPQSQRSEKKKALVERIWRREKEKRWSKELGDVKKKSAVLAWLWAVPGRWERCAKRWQEGRATGATVASGILERGDDDRMSLCEARRAIALAGHRAAHRRFQGCYNGHIPPPASSSTTLFCL
jgi:hypothetical protein